MHYEILVSEDNVRICEMISLFLRSCFEDITVTKAYSWDDIKHLNLTKFDLIITDVIMPGYTNKRKRGLIDLFRDIKTINVIFMSGFLFEEYNLENLSDNMKFIHKPFKLNDLRKLIEYFLGEMR